MNANYAGLLSKCIALSLISLAFAGCNKEATQSDKAAKPVEAIESKSPKSLPVVTLIGTKVQEDPASPTIRVQITASGPFGSNVIRKSDPERIIVIMHNAKIGEAPKNIEVNDGTISRIEIAQLDTGKGPATSIAIGLLGKSTYELIPAESALMIDIQKKK